MRKLNFGCGTIQPEGWDNVDIDDFGQQHIGSSEMFDAETFDIIVAHASIQQIEYHFLVEKLQDLRRILKSGGVLRISLPDIMEGFKAYQRGEKSWFPNGEVDLDNRFCAWLTWYSTTKSLLTKEALELKLNLAGFEKVKLSGFRQSFGQYPFDTSSLDTRNKEFFFMEAIK